MLSLNFVEMQQDFSVRFYNILQKYKILHIVFWTYLFFAMEHDSIIMGRAMKLIVHPYIDTSVLVFCKILVVYFTMYYVVPRTLNKGKYGQFILCFIFALFITALVRVTLQDLVTLLTEHRHLYRRSILPKFLSSIFDGVVILCIFLVAYFLKERIISERNKLRQEGERLKTELDFLKNQFNPHFLFNAINGICVLIRQDKQIAETALLRFSNLLRYQLYECSADTTSLSRELNFLRDYISLEKMRCNKNFRVNVDFPEIENNLEIAPFILSTFVENAFKHKSSDNSVNFVEITGSLDKNNFRFCVNNSVDVGPLEQEAKSKGIGLQNVKRRLDLIYQDKHSLKISKNGNVFSVFLELNLEK